MLTLPNFLSLMRFPLAMAFFQSNATIRAIAIFLAAFTDFFDGFLARKLKQTSRFGTVLDPISDKFFVMTALFAFLASGQIGWIEVFAMLCRDLSVIVFGIYLIVTKNFAKYHFRSIWSGKISTALQLIVLGALTFQIPIAQNVFGIFILLGIAALIELYLSDHSFIPAELKKVKK